MNTLNLTKEEMELVSERLKTIAESYRERQTLNEHLKAAYMAARPDVTDEKAAELVERLIRGCDSLTSKFREAVADGGFDAMAEVESLCAGKTLEEQYAFLMNALCAVQTLNLNAVESEPDSAEEFAKLSEEFAKRFPEANEEVCEALRQMLAEAVSNNALVLSGTEKARELLNLAQDGPAGMTDFLSKEYDDARAKAELALATWMEYEDGHIESVEPGTIPEAFGIGAAAAVEEILVLESAEKEGTTADKVIWYIKILGDAFLFCLLGMLTLVLMFEFCSVFSFTAMTLLGNSGIAAFIAFAIGVVLCCKAFNPIMKGIGIVVDTSDWLYDYVVEKLRTVVIPKVREVSTRIFNWFKEKIVALRNRSEVVTDIA